jgi:hypothetical protein
MAFWTAPMTFQANLAVLKSPATPILSLVNKNAIAGEIVLAATSPLW